MLIAFLILAQSAAAPPDGDLARFDLRTLRRACGQGGDDIVVCGRRDADRYRLRPLPDDLYRDAPLLAETGIVGNLRGSAVAEGATIGGFRSNRIMLRLKTPF